MKEEEKQNKIYDSLTICIKSLFEEENRWGETVHKKLNEEYKECRESGKSCTDPTYSKILVRQAENLFLSARALWGITTAYPILFDIEPLSKLENQKKIVREYKWIIEIGKSDRHITKKKNRYWWSKDIKPVGLTRTTAAVLLSLTSYLEYLRKIREKNHYKPDLKFGGVKLDEIMKDTTRAALEAANWLMNTMERKKGGLKSFYGQGSAKYHALPLLDGWSNIPEHIYRILLENHGDENRRDEYIEHAKEMMGDDIQFYLIMSLNFEDVLVDSRTTRDVLISLMLFKNLLIKDGDDNNSIFAEKDRNDKVDITAEILENRSNIVNSLFKMLRNINSWSDLVCDNTFITLALLLALNRKEVEVNNYEEVDNYNKTLVKMVERYLLVIDRTEYKERMKEDICILNSLIWTKFLMGENIIELIDAIHKWLDKNIIKESEFKYRADFIGWAAVVLSNIYDQDIR